MASPAWFMGFLAAFGPTRRYNDLFSMSDRELDKRGFDRNGLQRLHVAGLGGL